MSPKPYNKNAMVKGRISAVEKADQEDKEMVEIFWEEGEAPLNPRTCSTDAIKDRLSKDLYVPWHRIGVQHFEEWEKKGFKKARRGDYDLEPFSKEDRERLMRLLDGASLRK